MRCCDELLGLLLIIFILSTPRAVFAQDEGADISRLRWDFNLGFATVSGGDIGEANGVTIAFDKDARRYSWRSIKYNDQALMGNGRCFSLSGCGQHDFLNEHQALYGWVGNRGLMRYALQSGVGYAETDGAFGKIGKIAEPTIPIVASLAIGDARYMRFKLDAEYVINQAGPYVGVMFGVMLGSVW